MKLPVTKQSEITLIAVAVILVAAGFVYWFSSRALKTVPVPQEAAPAAVETPTGEAIQNAGIGTEIYTKANNPLADTLPETVAPVPNPIENAYKNPFE